MERLVCLGVIAEGRGRLKKTRERERTGSQSEVKVICGGGGRRHDGEVGF